MKADALTSQINISYPSPSKKDVNALTCWTKVNYQYKMRKSVSLKPQSSAVTLKKLRENLVPAKFT